MAYDAFISYRHGTDGPAAAAIERGLERLARPWNRLRAMSVFRDESELGAAADLTGAIKRALGEASHLILLASPESAASAWVDKEIEYWCDERDGAARIILVLTDGEFAWDDVAGAPALASTAVSSAVRARITTEPVYVDLRWARSAGPLSLRDSRFRADIVRIAATIRGVAPADLESEDIRIHRRARRLARAAVAVVVVLAVVASIAAIAALANARRADRRARDAVARQAGLAALDLPADDVDGAFLLSLIAGELDSDRSAEQYHASRVLIGRYSRLDHLFYAQAGTASVLDVAVSDADGTVLATATGADGAVMLSWPPGARSEPRVAALPAGVAPAVELTGSGERLLGRAPGRLVTAGVADGEAGTDVDGAVAVDVATGVAVTSTAGQPMRLVRLAGGDVLAEVEAVPRDVDARFGRGVATTADGLLLLLEASGGGARGPAGAVDAVAAGASDDVAAATADEQQLTTWRRDGAVLAPSSVTPLPGDLGTPSRLLLSSDATRALVIGTSGAALIEVGNADPLAVDAGATGIARPDPSGRYVAVGGARLTIWDLAAGQTVFTVPSPVNDMAWSGPCDGGATCTLATAGASLDAWQPATRRHVRLAEQTAAQTVAVSGDGSTIVAAGWGPVVSVWQLRPVLDDRGRTAVSAGDAAPATTCRGQDDDLRAASPAGRYVVTHDPADRATVVCDATTGDPVASATISAAVRAVPAEAVAVDDDGNVALAGGGGFVARFDRDGRGFGTGAAIDARLGEEVVAVTALAYNGHTVVAGTRPAATGSAARVIVWQVADGAMPVSFDADLAEVPAVALVGDAGELIAVAGRDRAGGPVTIQVWETDTRRRLGRGMGGLTGDVVALTGDATAVVAADAHGRAFRWELDRDPRREICAIVGRDVTEEEWHRLADGALRPYDRSSVCPELSLPGG